MQMGDGLTSGRPIVDANVESIGPVHGVDSSFCPVEKLHHGQAFFLAYLEKRTYVAFGDDETVPLRNRKSVVNPESVLVLLNYAFTG
jgi:hypothetical protein